MVHKNPVGTHHKPLMYSKFNLPEKLFSFPSHTAVFFSNLIYFNKTYVCLETAYIIELFLV